MDRLVCGDVGFGKTEVAVRAAFAVATGGKQVLVLCPTTILAEQHWNTFRDRYRDFPVRVEMVSRFRRPAEAKQVLREFTDGKVEVLVGTHRILSRDVVPKELGLVVVDEEQRFGVAQKELLRALRLEVDVLSLSATPIPRTLHMSLSGLRDISIIETPPEGRRPIRTTVAELDDELIRVALEREHARGGGQSFYLHNRVETIDEAQVKLQQLCPGLRFLVAHGQMSERELEERMHAFIAGDADVLVSTTIIESGIDIPQANTLVVERADMLGLAQLYQIRGRVGRSDVTAHAYLLYPSASELTQEARARLSTLADHTELGAGFHIAMRDLEIRGAGNLLGDEQSGHVAALGFELYVEMLNEAVAELSGQARPLARPVRVDARIDAFVPPRTSRRRRSRSTCTGGSRSSSIPTSCGSCTPRPKIASGRCPSRSRACSRSRRRSSRSPPPRADYLVFRAGKATVGPVTLGGDELRALRGVIDTAVYTSARREVAVRTDGLEGRSRSPLLSLTSVGPPEAWPFLWSERVFDPTVHEHVITAPERTLIYKGTASMKNAIRLALLTRYAAVPVLVASGCGFEEEVPSGAVAVVSRTEVPRADLDALMDRARKSRRAEAVVPEGRHRRVQVPPGAGRRVSRAAGGVRPGGRGARHHGADADIEKRNKQVLAQTYFGGSQKKLDAELKKQGYTQAQYRGRACASPSAPRSPLR